MSEITKIARSCIGTKFRHQGRIKNVGVDCIGLIIGVAKELDLQTHDKLDYARQPNGFQLQNEIEKYLNISNLQPEVIALLKLDIHPQHVGIITSLNGELGLLHAYAPARKVVEHRLDEVWLKRLVACYEFPK